MLHHISEIKYRWIYQEIISLKNIIAMLSNINIYIIHEYYFYSEILVIVFSLITWHLTFTPHSYIFKRKREVWLFVVVYACIDTHARVFTRDKEETKDTEVYANTCAKRIVMIECSRLVHIYISFIFFCFFLVVAN
jgi:hypothetical protein